MSEADQPQRGYSPMKFALDHIGLKGFIESTPRGEESRFLNFCMNQMNQREHRPAFTRDLLFHEAVKVWMKAAVDAQPFPGETDTFNMGIPLFYGPFNGQFIAVPDSSPIEIVNPAPSIFSCQQWPGSNSSYKIELFKPSCYSWDFEPAYVRIGIYDRASKEERDSLLYYFKNVIREIGYHTTWEMHYRVFNWRPYGLLSARVHHFTDIQAFKPNPAGVEVSTLSLPAPTIQVTFNP